MDKNEPKKTTFGYNLLLQSPIILSAIISLIVLVIYSGVLTGDFIMWDDDITIYENPHLGGLSLKHLSWAFTDVDSAMKYIPLTLLTWSTIYSIFGLNPFGYHLGSWILHGLNAVTLFFVIRKILTIYQYKNRLSAKDVYVNTSAFFAALIWALHPLRGDVVAQATNLAYCQALLFILFSTLFYLRAHDVRDNDNKTSIAMSFSFYIFSLLSYPLGITFFFIYLVLDIYLLKRIGHETGWWKDQASKKVLWEKMLFATPAVFIAAITVAIRIKSAGVWQPPVSLSEFGLIDRFFQAMYILAYYVWRPFYPVALSPVYTVLVSFKPLTVPFISSSLCTIAVCITVFAARKKLPLAAAVLLSYVILVVPFLGLFEHPHYPADRHSLLSSVCLSVLIAFFLFFLSNKRFYLKAAMIPAIALVLVLGALSHDHIKNWRNSEVFFSHIIETLGNDPYREDIYWRLGKYLYENGKEKEAVINFEKTLAINPYDPIAHRYLAQIEYGNDNLTRAAYHLQYLLISNPNDFEVHNQLSQIYNKIDTRRHARGTLLSDSPNL